MKFKPTIIYASMLAAGSLIALPAFADNHDARSQVAKMEAIMNQNQVNAGSSADVRDWFKRIQISGVANFDATLSDQKVVVGSDNANEDSSNFSLNNTDIILDAPVNDWTAAHISMRYLSKETKNTPLPYVAHETGFHVNEAYVSMHDFRKMPLFAKVGTQYVDFGAAKPNQPVVFGLSQLLTQTRATAVTVGLVTPQGIYGSAYTFRGLQEPGNSRINNFGLQAGWAMDVGGGSFDAGIGYLYDMSSTSYIKQRKVSNGIYDAVHGLNAHIKAGFGPFYGGVDFTTALTDFDSRDLMYSGEGARPWGMDLDAGFRFKTAGRDSSVELGYGRTHEAAGSVANNMNGLYLPRHRYQASYKVNLMDNTDVALAVIHDRDYSENRGGTGEDTTTGKLRLSVHFA